MIQLFNQYFHQNFNNISTLQIPSYYYFIFSQLVSKHSVRSKISERADVRKLSEQFQNSFRTVSERRRGLRGTVTRP